MSALPRVSAVSYLNTSPLVWGLTRGPQQGLVDLRFDLPAECADALRSGAADIGLVPVIELARQPDLVVIPGSAIACTGPVRSILIVSKKPLEEIESLAADTGSRTSVVMTQTLLARKFGILPRVRPYPPKLTEMLEVADAALIIGDPALHLDPEMTEYDGQPVHVYDMGVEWVETTGLPMVFAVWAAKRSSADPRFAAIFEESAAYGAAHIDEIVAAEAPRLGLSPDLVRDYVTRSISYTLGEDERRAMAYFLKAAGDLGIVEPGRTPNFLAVPALT